MYYNICLFVLVVIIHERIVQNFVGLITVYRFVVQHALLVRTAEVNVYRCCKVCLVYFFVTHAPIYCLMSGVSLLTDGIVAFWFAVYWPCLYIGLSYRSVLRCLQNALSTK